MDEDRTIFLIPDVNLKTFEAACAKLSRKALKIGGSEIKPYVFGYRMEKLADGRDHRLYEILFTVEAPKINGWTFVARLDHANETGNIIRMVPNTIPALPEEYRTAKPHCDHCRLTRKRRDTFVLRCDETGEFKQIGATCLIDFFGHDPQKMARMAELLGYADEAARGATYFEFGGALTDHRWIDVATFCEYAAAAVRLYGWVSGRVAYDDRTKIATRAHAIGWYMEHLWDPNASAARAAFITEADRVLAAEALEWAVSLREKSNLSEYEHNILVVAEAAMMEARSAGLAASIVGVFDLNRRRSTERRAYRALTESVYIGTVGDKLTDREVTLLSTHPAGGEWPGIIYRMLDTDGNVLEWRASKSAGDLQIGGQMRISGTIKGHFEFKGIKKTNLTRCTIMPIAR